MKAKLLKVLSSSTKPNQGPVVDVTFSRCTDYSLQLST